MADAPTLRDVTTTRNHVVSPDVVTRKLLGPRMRLVHEHLVDMRRRFSRRPLKRDTSYDLPGLGVLRTSQMENFSLRADDDEAALRIKFTFDNVAPAPLGATLSSSEQFFSIRRVLEDHKIPFHGATAGNVGKLTCGERVPVDVRFAAHRSSGSIWIRLRNLGGLVLTEVYHPPSQVNARLMGALETLILGEDEDFYSLIGFPCPPAPMLAGVRA